MNTSKPREETILAEALAFTSAEARQAYLHGACGDNRTLRSQVESLIAAHEAAGQFLADSQRPDSPTLLESPAILEGPGTRIGRYKLLQQIGEGGMGVVYMAEQEEPVRRRVALKIIKLGMDTRQVVARFEAERQALAMMDHPNIARVLDGGTTDTGRPYFVMELVQGVAMTEFCDRNRLPAKERLQLFTTVCQAVQHAHQKGIIHRDIKPSNVLVTLHDGVPVPKVIDFGIAKATNQKLTEKTLFTNFATMIGTPAYMSPEQAEMSGLDVDTRTDIYALGVLLYQLLTGTTPFPEKRLRSLAYGEMQRVIVDEEPQRPSTRLSTMANEERTIVAGNCGEELEALSRRLKGDLDWIVMRCLEKDRTRRYETANGLANDIQRHLANEPVMARPPSTAYRFQKLVRRNRGTVLAVAVIAMTLVGALGFSTSAYLKEKAARRQAALAELAREAARRATEQESIRAESVTRFVSGFFDTIVPELYRHGHRESIHQLLLTADRFANDLTNAPLAEAQLRLAIASTFSWYLYDDEKAVPQYEQTERIALRLGHAGEPLLNKSRRYRAGSEKWVRLDESAAQAEVALARAALRQTPPDFDGAAGSLGGATEFYLLSMDPEKARTYAAEALRIASGSITRDGLEARLTSLRFLMLVSSGTGDGAAAETYADQYFETLRTIVGNPRSKEGPHAVDFFNSMWINDWTSFPVPSLRKALNRLDPDQPRIHGILQSLLGVAIAKSGAWREGLSLIRSVDAAVDSSDQLWILQCHLAMLLEDSALQRSLAISGIAQFGNGADARRSVSLLQELLMLPTDAAFTPVISGLAKGLASAPKFMTRDATLVLALHRYRIGEFKSALALLDEVQRIGPGPFRLNFDTTLAHMAYLRAAILARSGDMEAARVSYREGLRLLPPNRIALGHPDTGPYWETTTFAEILRREAAKLIGDVNP